MRELMIDFITSLDGYASGEGWPGWWGLEGPEYLAWLGEQPPVTYLMGANTYRLMFGFAGGELPTIKKNDVAVLTNEPFSNSLLTGEPPPQIEK